MKFHKVNTPKEKNQEMKHYQNPRKHSLCFLPATNPYPKVTPILTSNSTVLLPGFDLYKMESYTIIFVRF